MSAIAAAEVGMRERADARRRPSPPPGRESTLPEPSASRKMRWSEIALLVRGRAADERARRRRPPCASPAAAASSAFSQVVGRSMPPSRTSGCVTRSSEAIAW